MANCSFECESVILKNDFLEAYFDKDTGDILHLSEPGGENLIKSWCSCFSKNCGDETKIFNSKNGEDSIPFEYSSIQVEVNSVSSILKAGGIEIFRSFDLTEHSSVLRVTYSVASLQENIEINRLSFPEISFDDSFVNIFEDEDDLYFDGQELGCNKEIPCWRVFFKEGHGSGIIMATRSKYEMSHFQILEKSVSIRPHIMTAYSTNVLNAVSPMKLNNNVSYSARFEIGPWSRGKHETIFEAAELDRVTDTDNIKLTGTPPEGLKGNVMGWSDFAHSEKCSELYDNDKWMVVKHPCSISGSVLMASPNTNPPDIVIDPDISGIFDVYIGIVNGDGVTVRVTGESMPIYRMASVDLETPFELRLSGEQSASEIFLGTFRMDKKSLMLSKTPSSYATTFIDYVRFETISEERQKQFNDGFNQPKIPLSGFSDIPDITRITDSRDPDPAAYMSNIWEHARCGITKIYWRIDGQCSDFPCKSNTMRYISAKVHGLFSPNSKGYGRALKKFDMLEVAVEASRKYNIKLYGWMRFNSYIGNVKSDFFKNNPQFHEKNIKGINLGKLCLAFPEVRKHKIDILIEAAKYGLDGINLGFLRHPPVLEYAPVLIEGYKEKYGISPPLTIEGSELNYINSLPPSDEEHIKWFGYRAGFLTEFGRELKAALAENNLAHVKISLWVRPNHCLFDGIDIDQWLEEGLCDEIVADGITSANYDNEECYGIREEWKQKVQSHVPLIRGISGMSPVEKAEAMAKEAIENNYDGVCTYESNYTVLTRDFIDLYAGLT